jgi:SulP family sulfate permease
MASLAALLLVVAWNMSEVKHVRRMLRVAPTSDVVVLLTCYALTVFFDMVTAVSVGIGLAALLFMRRMVEVSDTRLSEDDHPDLPGPLPKGVFVYDIVGPLFFGAAEKDTATLGEVAGRAKVLILRLEQVPAIDVTGLVALESALETLTRQHTLAIITGLRAQPREVLTNAGIVACDGCLLVCDDIESALAAAKRHIGSAQR